MDSKSRARSSHYLLLLGARKLPENGLGYRGGRLDCQGVHEHVRRRRHVGPDPQPAGCQFDATPTKFELLFTRMSVFFGLLDSKEALMKRHLCELVNPTLLARISGLIGLSTKVECTVP